MDVFGALTALQQTIDLTKSFRNIDEKIDAATWKIRLSDLVDKLIDTKDALIEAKERERELREEIDKLKSQLNIRRAYEDQGGLLFEIGADRVRLGEPYCNQCHVKEDRLFRLIYGPFLRGTHKCNNCQGVFGPKTDTQLDNTIARVRRSDWDDFI